MSVYKGAREAARDLALLQSHLGMLATTETRMAELISKRFAPLVEAAQNIQWPEDHDAYCLCGICEEHHTLRKALEKIL